MARDINCTLWRCAGTLRAIGLQRRRKAIMRRSMCDRHTASSIARQAPCAKYCSIGWAASPSSADAAVDPLLDRIAVAQHPQPPVPAVTDDAFCAFTYMGEALAHLLVRHGLPATGSGASL